MGAKNATDTYKLVRGIYHDCELLSPKLLGWSLQLPIKSHRPKLACQANLSQLVRPPDYTDLREILSGGQKLGKPLILTFRTQIQGSTTLVASSAITKIAHETLIQLCY